MNYYHRTIKAILICLALTACGKGNEYYISQDLQKYVNLFESLYGAKIDFDVVIADLDSEYVGMCTMWTDGSKKIEISAKYMSLMHDSQIEETVFHELGHCYFGRDHEDTFIYMSNSWLPKSIMYSYVHPDYLMYEQNRSWYYRELANPNLE